MLSAVHQALWSRQNPTGGWGFRAQQDAIEPACLAILALRGQQGLQIDRAVRPIESLQNQDGSWPAFAGDEPKGCWTTALAALSLMCTGRRTGYVASAIQWLLAARG
ncbi:MAG TPA: hypothetical protein VMP01_16060, partial [Pirellulaceae bacterium]|nr:hypothetical protein [Pirellulaceae bacterium]